MAFQWQDGREMAMLDGQEMRDLIKWSKTQDKTQDALTGTRAVRVYTLDGIKDGEADFSGDGPVPVYTLDGTVRIRVPRPVASRKTLDGDCIYTC